MAKLFFDVFPTLDVSGDMKKILSEMEVTKVGMNHERESYPCLSFGQSSYT